MCPGLEWLGFFLALLCETLHKDGRLVLDESVHLSMSMEFTPVFLFIFVAVMTAVGMLVASAFLGPKKATAIKEMPYESGMDPIGDARQRFDVRYYLVAIVFLLFDVELLFLYPWAAAQWSIPAQSSISVPAEAIGQMDVVVAGIPPVFRNLVFFEILVFVGVLTAAFAYAWRKGVFEWR